MLTVIAVNTCKAQVAFKISQTPLKFSCRLNSTGDTLTILDKTVKVIVIDGKTYDIIRTTDIKESELPTNINYFNGIKFKDIKLD